MRVKQSAAISLFLLFCLFSSLSQASWRGKGDNKPLSELKAMDDEELVSEATNVCIPVTTIGKFNLQVSSDGIEYLLTISHVASKKHGGKTPQWMSDIFGAVNKKDEKECVRILSNFEKQQKKTTQQKEAPKEGKIEARLQELKTLLDKGLITTEEYEKKRTEILKEL
jgi:membrane protease subunit (stomatin/prohibitin family)